ncbi:hypothetical protein N7528_008290 [Penicillium herquei]|nr:hypothetical protein N7528_008290 [Penicillium herquei]
MSDDYVFPRDYLEINRLNLHHYLLRETLGYLVHPSIPTENPNLRIADIGTGTGLRICADLYLLKTRIWLTDLAHQLPSSARLDGLDISLGSATPRQWLPDNVTLRQWDIHTEVPEDLVGVYDIVHASLLIFVIKTEELPAVFARLLKLLKPGGHLQWLECDISTFRIRKTSPENKTEALMDIYNLLESSESRTTPSWTGHLPESFRENGLVDVECDARDPPPEMVMPLHECNLLIHENMARGTANPQWSQTIKKALPGIVRETQAGAAWDFTRVVVVGKKPLD